MRSGPSMASLYWPRPPPPRPPSPRPATRNWSMASSFKSSPGPGGMRSSGGRQISSLAAFGSVAVHLDCDPRCQRFELSYQVELVVPAGHPDLGDGDAHSSNSLLRRTENRHAEAVSVIDRFFAVHREPLCPDLLELALQIFAVSDAVFGKAI